MKKLIQKYLIISYIIETMSLPLSLPLPLPMRLTNIVKRYLNQLHSLPIIPIIPPPKKKTVSKTQETQIYFIKYSSIFVFYNFKQKSKNDENNKTRELLISAILNKQIPKIYYDKSRVWKSFQTNLTTFVTTQLFGTLYHAGTVIKCITMAGRKYNYDFQIESENAHSAKKLKIVLNVEFKFGATCIENCPQFIQIPANFETVSPYSYAEFFYDNYVETLSKLYNIPVISRDDYLKYIYQINYSKHQWFEHLYKYENLHKVEKKKIVDKSIHHYLKTYGPNINLTKLTKKFKSTQGEKQYMLYSPKTLSFYQDEILNSELTVNPSGNYSFSSNRGGLIHTVILDTEHPTTKIHMLLRWKNHAGILNPAWQIALKRSKIKVPGNHSDSDASSNPSSDKDDIDKIDDVLSAACNKMDISIKEKNYEDDLCSIFISKCDVKPSSPSSIALLE